jgi:hypothetical protein
LNLACNGHTPHAHPAVLLRAPVLLRGAYHDTGTAPRYRVPPATPCWRRRGVGFEPTPGAGEPTAVPHPRAAVPARPGGTPPGNTGGIRYRRGTTGHHWVIPVAPVTPLGIHWYHGDTSPNPGCPVPASGTHVKLVENWY